MCYANNNFKSFYIYYYNFLLSGYRSDNVSQTAQNTWKPQKLFETKI